MTWFHSVYHLSQISVPNVFTKFIRLPISPANQHETIKPNRNHHSLFWSTFQFTPLFGLDRCGKLPTSGCGPFTRNGEQHQLTESRTEMAPENGMSKEERAYSTCSRSQVPGQCLTKEQTKSHPMVKGITFRKNQNSFYYHLESRCDFSTLYFRRL